MKPAAIATRACTAVKTAPSIPSASRDGLQVGDIIEVEMDDSHVMEASALAYMLPLAGFIVGLAAGWVLTKTGVKMNGELLMALCAVIGTAAAYFIMRAIDPKLSKGRWEQKIISVTHPRRRKTTA